jgi:hypothetical protein
VAQQQAITVRYDDIIVGEYFADLLVEGAVVVVMKAVKTLDSVHNVTCCAPDRVPATDGHWLGMIFRTRTPDGRVFVTRNVVSYVAAEMEEDARILAGAVPP